jgi:dTDP-L-rhamnose 4-epimerase
MVACERHRGSRPTSRRTGGSRAARGAAPTSSRSRSTSPCPQTRATCAATKLHQEHLSFAYGREHAASVVALRYHNVYGPRMPRDTPYAGVASIFRSALAAGRPPQVFEDGGQRRDFVHVRDVARANVIALTTPNVVSGMSNIASGEQRTVLEMARTIATEFSPSAPMPEVVPRYRIGDVRHVFGAADRAREMLRFEAEIPFAAGMREFATAELRAPVGPVRSSS